MPNDEPVPPAPPSDGVIDGVMEPKRERQPGED
jgi:hypothetical protein